MAGPFARIEALLGVPALAQVAEDSLRRLVEGGVREDSDLEFKESLYGGTEGERRSLAGDVAALANTVGGVLVLGVREQDGIARDLIPLELSEEEELRMRQVLASWAAPVPVLAAVHRVPGSKPGQGYFVIAVPRSPDRPHAVRVNEGLRYPVRNGPTTRFLSESEVADAYRNRFKIADEIVAQVKRVEDTGVARLDLSEFPWLVLSLVPDSPGEMELRHRTVRQLQEWVERYPYPLLSYVPLAQGQFRAYTGVRRVIASQVVDNQSGLSTYGHLELHTDGSGFAATPIWSARREEAELDLRIDDELLVGETAAMLDVLVAHATSNTHTSGTAVVRIRVISKVRSLSANVEFRPMRLTHSRGFASSGILSPYPCEEPTPSEHSVDLGAIRDSRQELLVSVRLILSDVFQAFGYPEILQIDAEGSLRWPYINNESRPRIRAWCETNGVTIVESTVEAP